MVEVINIYIQHTKNIDIMSLYRCYFVCKELNNLLEDLNLWNKCKFEKKIYNNKNCIICDNNKKKIIAFGTCNNCLKYQFLISATDAKKRWYLNDTDLLQLNVCNKTNMYKTNIRLFNKTDLFEYALFKYNGSKNLKIFIDNKIIKSNKLKETKLKNILIKENIKNIRKEFLISKLIENNLEIDDDLTTCNQYINNERDDIVNIITILQEYKKIKNNKLDRKNKLTIKLHENGLELRNDSRVCDDYINGIRNNMDEVITIMLEMNFFIKKTQYKNIMNNLINDYKKTIRENYGFLEYDEYQELIDDQIHKLSDKAKKIAIKNQKNIPEYCKKYLK